MDYVRLCSSETTYGGGARACGDFDATDTSDKVYALLGIAKDTERLRITVDYSESPVAGFADVSKALILKYCVNILSFNAAW